jgi:hypothetical protein
VHQFFNGDPTELWAIETFPTRTARCFEVAVNAVGGAANASKHGKPPKLIYRLLPFNSCKILILRITVRKYTSELAAD